MTRPLTTVIALTTLTINLFAAVQAEACGGRQRISSRRPIVRTYTAIRPIVQATHSRIVYSPVPAPVSNPVPSSHLQLAVPPTPVQGGLHQGSESQIINPSSAAVQAVLSESTVDSGQGSGMNVSNPVSQQSTSSLTSAQAGTGSRLSPTTSDATGAMNGGAEDSALKLLDSMVGNRAQAPTANQQQSEAATNSSVAPASTNRLPSHLGKWIAILPETQRVDLQLREQGTFSWTATKNGKSSTFEGQYLLQNGRLILVRSNDLQQMSGSWTATEQGFDFHLEGANTGSLNFVRTSSSQ